MGPIPPTIGTILFHVYMFGRCILLRPPFLGPKKWGNYPPTPNLSSLATREIPFLIIFPKILPVLEGKKRAQIKTRLTLQADASRIYQNRVEYYALDDESLIDECASVMSHIRLRREQTTIYKGVKTFS